MLGVKDSGAGINRVTDGATGAVDSTITIGDTIDIEGDKVRIAGDAEGVGVFFYRRFRRRYTGHRTPAPQRSEIRTDTGSRHPVERHAIYVAHCDTVHYGYRPAERTPYHRIRTPAYYFRRRGRRRQARNRIASSLYKKNLHKGFVAPVTRPLCCTAQDRCDGRQGRCARRHNDLVKKATPAGETKEVTSAQ